MLPAHQPRLVHAIPPADHVALDRDPLLIHPASAEAADYNRHDLGIRMPRKEKKGHEEKLLLGLKLIINHVFTRTRAWVLLDGLLDRVADR